MKRTLMVIALLVTVLAVRLPVGIASSLPPIGVTLAHPEQRSDTVISFVNAYSGSIMYELDGHSGIRVTTPSQDYIVNFGLFEFQRPGFVYHFLKGETDYSVGKMPWQHFLNYYLQEDRRVVEHELNLSTAEKQRLIALLDEHVLPWNRVYRYNYVKDNCATRPLRMVELAVGDSIVLGAPQLPEADVRTFRSVMRHYHRNYPWYQFGIDLALGPGVDYAIDNRERAFAPTVLDGQLPDATVAGRPLVVRTTPINDTPPEQAMLPPTPWILTPMAFGLLVLVLATAFTIRDWQRCRVTRWFDAALFAVYGLSGLVVAFLVFISQHEATSPNYLLLWLNPLCLVPTVCLWWRGGRRIVYYYQILNLALLVGGALAWPWLGQSGNAAFVPLVLADALRAASYIRNYHGSKA